MKVLLTNTCSSKFFFALYFSLQSMIIVKLIFSKFNKSHAQRNFYEGQNKKNCIRNQSPENLEVLCPLIAKYCKEGNSCYCFLFLFTEAMLTLACSLRKKCDSTHTWSVSARTCTIKTTPGNQYLMEFWMQRWYESRVKKLLGCGGGNKGCGHADSNLMVVVVVEVMFVVVVGQWWWLQAVAFGGQMHRNND